MSTTSESSNVDAQWPGETLCRKTTPQTLSDRTNIDKALWQPSKPTKLALTDVKIPTTESPAVAIHTGANVILVAFKAQCCQFSCPFDVAPGEHVIIECDRGFRCGKVLKTSPKSTSGPHLANQDTALLAGKTFTDQSELPGGVLRIATDEEKYSLLQLKHLELHAFRVCQEIMVDLALPCALLDCEFQFDRKKVTFFFRSAISIDFRNLVRELYKIFGARIWMQNVNPQVRNEAPHATDGTNQPMGHEKHQNIAKGHDFSVLRRAEKSQKRVDAPSPRFPRRAEQFLRPQVGSETDERNRSNSSEAFLDGLDTHQRHLIDEIMKLCH
ncbi:hypothetical protein XU18_2695 [Perkinsela sp. CCAP 1560/4]|nr:hypothetical protein XU18_2695 [Perkinsela sp. CCAP 1560/4]|eukprot:KNH06491.1 hypothetical protein XU18_2695 [Perkinsela sp. CCAP 1560/4]